MRFKDVFSIIGPSMIGPSSSHTAGAVRLGRCARQALGGMPQSAVISFHGSFADTYMGHGTDLAITAGIMDFDTDDERISDSIRIAASAGIDIVFRSEIRPGPHPNTAAIKLQSGDRLLQMTGCSIGGGNIEIVGVNGFDVKFTAIYPTLLIYHRDRAGVIAEVTQIAKTFGINISYMEVDRKTRNGEALTVIESDEPFREHAISKLEQLEDVREICLIDLTGRVAHT